MNLSERTISERTINANTSSRLGLTVKDSKTNDSIRYPIYTSNKCSQRQVYACEILSVLTTPDTYIIGFLEEYPQVSIPKELCPSGKPKLGYFYVKTFDSNVTLWSPNLFNQTFTKNKD